MASISDPVYPTGAPAPDIGRRADDAVGNLGGGMKSLAQRLRSHAPHEGPVGSAAGALADTLDSGGRYLETEGVSGIAEEVTNFIRKNPMPALLAGLAAGYLLARVIRR